MIQFALMRLRILTILPSMQVFCFCPITLLINGLRRRVMQHKASLWWIDRREIGRQFPVRVGSFCPFLSKRIMPVLRLEVSEPSLQHSLIALRVINFRLDQNFLSQFTVKPSIPGALEPFIFLKSEYSSSSSVISRFIHNT